MGSLSAHTPGDLGTEVVGGLAPARPRDSARRGEFTAYGRPASFGRIRPAPGVFPPSRRCPPLAGGAARPLLGSLEEPKGRSAHLYECGRRGVGRSAGPGTPQRRSELVSPSGAFEPPANPPVGS